MRRAGKREGRGVSDPKTTAQKWASDVAAVAVDGLMDAGLIPRDGFERARSVVAEEILVRLCLNDYPPPVDVDVAGDEISRLRGGGGG